MAKIFQDGDMVTKEWLNKVSKTVTDACGDQVTPTNLRIHIGAETAGAAGDVQAELNAHKADIAIHYPDAPNDTKEYVRGQGEWKVAAFTEAPIDDESYGRRNGAWSIVSDSGATDHQALANRGALDAHPQSAITGLTGDLSTLQAHAVNLLNPHNVTVAQLGAATPADVAVVQDDLDAHKAIVHLGDSPADGEYYGRKDSGWAIIPGTGTGVDPSDHSQLLNRSAADAHPIASITDLQGKVSAYDGHIASDSNPHGVTAAQANADPAGSASAVQGNLNTHAANVDLHIGHASSDSEQYVSKNGIWSILDVVPPAVETDHTKMTNRDQPNQHSIGSVGISGGVQLQDEIDRIDAEVASKVDATTLTAHASDASIHYVDVASDGKNYVRKNKAWSELPVSGAGDLKSDFSVKMVGSPSVAQDIVTKQYADAVFTDRLAGYLASGGHAYTYQSNIDTDSIYMTNCSRFVNGNVFGTLPTGWSGGGFITIKRYSTHTLQIIQDEDGTRYVRRSIDAGTSWDEWVDTSLTPTAATQDRTGTMMTIFDAAAGEIQYLSGHASVTMTIEPGIRLLYQLTLASEHSADIALTVVAPSGGTINGGANVAITLSPYQAAYLHHKSQGVWRLIS